MAKKSKAAKQDSSKAWGALSAVSGILAATAVRKLLTTGWKAATGKEPPANPADPDVAMREAVLWATVSGTTVALARMAAGRRAAKYYVKSTGKLPPELESDAVREARKQDAALAERAAEAEAAAASSGKGRRKKRKG